MSTNWFGVIFWGLLLGIAGLIIYAIVSGYINLNSLTQQPLSLETITNNLTIDKLTSFADKYGAVLGLAGTGIVTVYGFYQKHKASVAQAAQLTAETKTTEVELKANTQINQLQGQAESYKQKYETLLNTQDNTLLLESQKLVSQKETELKTLQSRYNEIKDQLEAEIQKRPVITKTEVL